MTDKDSPLLSSSVNVLSTYIKQNYRIVRHLF